MTGCARIILSPSGDRRGVLLVIVLWICFGLVVTAIYFGDAMRLEYRAADNALAEREGAAAIDGAERYILYTLTNSVTAGEMLDPTLYQFDGGKIGEATYWLIGRNTASSTNARGSNKFSLNSSFGNRLRTATSGDAPVFNLVDESSKININTASQEVLEALPGMTAELAGAIVDWRDTDSDVSMNGAEEETYMLLQTPYLCKNASFETVDELRLVNGATMDILRGEDANSNGVLDPNENDGDTSYPPDNADGKLDPGVLEYLTVYPKASSTSTSGTMVSVSTSTIESALTTDLGQERARAIAQAATGRITQVHNLLQLAAAGDMTSTELDTVLADNSVSIQFAPARDSGGPINVNTAPAAVLAAVLGGDPAIGEQLVAARQGHTVTDQYKMGWVLDAIDHELIMQYGGALTNKAVVFSADIAAVGHNGRGYRRDLFIIDCTGSQPYVRYRRDLTRLGWPLGNAVQLASQRVSNTGGLTSAGRDRTGS